MPRIALAGEIEGSTGFLRGAAVIAQVARLSAVFLPFQASPVLVAAGLGGTPAAYAARQGVASVLLAPLTPVEPTLRPPRAV